MELHQIRYFLAVVDAHNFTRAAERCNVSDTLSRELVDPAVTRRIALLRNVDHPGSPAAKLLWETMLEVSSSITEGAKAPA